jgi:hypothetical protein
MKNTGLVVLWFATAFILLGYEVVALLWRGPTRPTWSKATWETLDLLGRWKWAVAGPLLVLLNWVGWHWAFEMERGVRPVIAATIASLAAGLLTLWLWPK